MSLEQDALQEDLIRRLKRIEGQVRGIQKMIDEGRSCEDIVIQLTAVRAALDTVTARLVANHASRCLDQLSSEQAKAAVDRAIRLLTKTS